jgi:hypothetical protein
LCRRSADTWIYWQGQWQGQWQEQGQWQLQEQEQWQLWLAAWRNRFGEARPDGLPDLYASGQKVKAAGFRGFLSVYDYFYEPEKQFLVYSYIRVFPDS